MNFAIADIIIALTSISACTYCYVLGRRLNALQNTKDGLGAAILAFSKSANAMSATTKQTGAHAQDLAQRLATLMNDANIACKQIEDMTLSMETRHQHAVKDVANAQAELETRIGGILNDYKKQVTDLADLTVQLQSLIDTKVSPGGTHSELGDNVQPFSPHRKLVRSN